MKHRRKGTLSSAAACFPIQKVTRVEDNEDVKALDSSSINRKSNINRRQDKTRCRLGVASTATETAAVDAFFGCFFSAFS